jgi:hypothetical protein
MSPIISDPTARGRAASLFLLAAAVTALSVGVNLAFPGLAPTGIQQTIVRVLIYGAILVGLWVGLSRASFRLSTRRAVWLAIAVPFTIWLAAIWWLAVAGAFVPRSGGSVPRLPLAIFVPLIIAVPLLLRSRHVAAVLDATPPSWLVGLQVYRVLGSAFLVAWIAGKIPGFFALPAGIGDVTVGLLALPVAVWLHSDSPSGRSAAIAWNLLGLLDFTIAVGLGILSAPTPLQLIVPAHPTTLVATYPTVMIPAFAVASSIILHALSFRQLFRAARRAAPAAPSRGAAVATG